MTRPAAEYEAALKLINEGINDCEISRRLGIPRGTIKDWRRPTYVPKGLTEPIPRGTLPGSTRFSDCPRCDGAFLDREDYAYLLGLYLGDGYIVRRPDKPVYRLRIFLDQRYPLIIDECYGAIERMKPDGRMKVGFVTRAGCFEVNAYWKHWPCLFPQHGDGMKHLRDVALAPWQQEIVDTEPKPFLRGLIHSDGWRGTNFALVRGKRYEYPRYQFTNESQQIHEMFRHACDVLGVRWTSAPRQTYVSRRPDVKVLDSFIGMKK